MHVLKHLPPSNDKFGRYKKLIADFEVVVF